MGYVNVIWQGDANAVALRALTRCEVPSWPLNLTGPEMISVRSLCERFANAFGIPKPEFQGVEAPSALLSNAGLCHERFGIPEVTLDQMIRWVTHWVEVEGNTLEKPTKFEVRDGRF